MGPKLLDPTEVATLAHEVVETAMVVAQVDMEAAVRTGASFGSSCTGDQMRTGSYELRDT